MSSVNNYGIPESIVNRQADILPPASQNVDWLKDTPYLTPSELIRNNHPDLAVHSFRGSIEKAFEQLKELGNLIDGERKSPATSAVSLIREKLEYAKEYLSIISAALEIDPQFMKTYGSTVGMMAYRLGKYEDWCVQADVSSGKSKLQQLLNDVRKIIPAVVPAAVPEDFYQLKVLTDRVLAAAIAFAREHVTDGSPHFLLTRRGEQLGTIKRLLQELNRQKALVFDQMVAQGSPEVKLLLDEFQAIAGFIPLDQKWAVQHLAELNLKFQDFDRVTKTYFPRSVRDLFNEILKTAKEERETNRKAIENDEYTLLSAKIRDLLTELTMALPDFIQDGEKANDLNRKISGFGILLMSRIGGLFNSQPMTDTLATVYGHSRSGTSGRHTAILASAEVRSYAYPVREQNLLRNGFSEFAEYGFWLKVEHFVKSNGRIIDLKNTLDFTREDGTSCRVEVVDVIDLSPLDWISDEHLQRVVDFAEKVASREEGDTYEGLIVDVQHPDRIPAYLQKALLNDVDFWNRVETKTTVPADADAIDLAVKRYLALESLLENFTLSVNKKLRRIFYESSSKTASTSVSVPPLGSYSKTRKMRYTVKWIFAILGKTLINAFRTSSGKKIHANHINDSLKMFNPITFLSQNRLAANLRMASEGVQEQYTEPAAKLENDADKEVLLNRLAEIESTFSDLETRDMPLFAILRRQKQIDESRKKMEMRIASLDDARFRETKRILTKYLEEAAGKAQLHLESIVGILSEQVEKLFHLPSPYKSYPEYHRKALIIKAMFDEKLAKSIERVALKGKPLEYKDDKVIQTVTMLPNAMLDPLECACLMPELRPILADYLMQPDFEASLDLLNATPKAQKIAVQRQFMEACLEKLNSLPASPSVEKHIKKITKALNELNS